MIKILLLSALFGLTALAPSACRQSAPADVVTPPKPRTLVKAELLGTYTPEQLKGRYNGATSFLRLLTQFGIKVYRLSYNTTNTDGRAIVASGAVLVPQTTQALSLISMQHGTISSDDQAPSYYRSSSEAYTFGSVFASVGYIVAAPDYIGYGASNNVPHPYEHNASLASASLDMLRATKEFLADEHVNWNEKLYTAGYSEGGFATMALQKKLEAEALGEFNLIASSAGAGAYDKPAFMQHIVNTRTQGSIDYNRLYLWVLLTYDRVYGLNRPASYYFKEPYASRVQANGRSALLNVSFNEALTDTFRQAVQNGTDADFIRSVQDNDIHDWKPITPTRLYHGDADNTVFYFNTQNAYDAMQKQGATNVGLYRLPGRTHATGILDFVLGTFEFFSSKQAQ
ncbi:alpha/beta hydrolase family protein [Fibrivirga algicola]|uniref:Phospholipase n=1 Tax=Fibrivirga algicola TaxID=2950420 RepID=A0ABX0QCN3_9BACT|nr:lipase family protein [Fibrivirga algicola]NID09006.1 phospholipase [Fibrivirga algicola]